MRQTFQFVVQRSEEGFQGHGITIAGGMNQFGDIDHAHFSIGWNKDPDSV